MNKKLIIVCTCLAFAASASPGGKQAEAPSGWPEAVVRAKQQVHEQMKRTRMPLASEIVRAKEAARHFTADVSGLDEMVLYTWGTVDGTADDQAVWADARLIAADGSAVGLHELKEAFEADGPLLFDANAKGAPVTIHGKTYSHTILANTNRQIVVPLQKRYVRFEAEIGLDNRSSAGTAVFILQGVTGRLEAEALIERFPDEACRFLPFAGSDMKALVTACDASIEKHLARAVVSLLDYPGCFSARLAATEQAAGPERQAAGYLGIACDAWPVYRLQEELRWLDMQAIEAAFDDMKRNPAYDRMKNGTKLTELKALVVAGFDGLYAGSQEARNAARRALQLKKEILLANPALDIDKLIVGRYRIGTTARQVNPRALGTQNNNWSNQTSAARRGFDAEITELSELRGELRTRVIYKPGNGSSVPDLKLHWDAGRILFSKVDTDGRWQVFEVGLDGRGLKKVIRSPEKDLEFFDAAYLPSGKIIAVSNIGYNGVPCVNGNDEVGNLVLYDPANGSLRRLTFDQDANWSPVVMENGKVMYTRWEYTDLTHYFSRFVMHMNPDGTEQKALYGSGSYFPNSTFDAIPVPGHAPRFAGIVSGHHGVARSGRLMLFDPAKGRKSVEGIVQELPFRERTIVPEVKDRLVDGVWPQFIKPYPLDDKYFLVTAKLDPNGLWGIYLADVFDNLTRVAEFESEGLIYSIPVRKTPVPPVIPDRIDPHSKQATVFIQDIYEGEGLRGVPRGTVKSFRVLAYEYAYNKTPSDHWAQGIQSGWDIKRLLGTVPVEADGSALFTIPANTPVSLQPLDSCGRAVQWMRSWLTGMPGETVSCVGCHEDQNRMPIPKRVIASAIRPHALAAPEGGRRPFTFELEVQPVLTRACVACHDGSGSKPDFTAGRIDTFSGFGKSYLALHPFVHRQGPEAEMEVLDPYEYHVSTSPLVKILRTGHHGVQLTDKEWQALYNWIDFNAPYHSRFKANRFKGVEQIGRRTELADKYAGAGVNWQEEIRQYAAYLHSRPEPVPVKPAPVNRRYKTAKAKGWPFDAATAARKQEAEPERRKRIELAPGIRVELVRIPAGKFVMGSNSGYPDCAPAHRQEVKKAFWMATTEITNEQFRVFFPRHDSRFVNQLWKDHVHPGYPANLPEQPVIRVSWEEAMAFCRALSEKTGLTVTLPTEKQWEWACRAGSDSDCWYGPLGTDFAPYENLADRQLNKMAVRGVNPQPMNPGDAWYPYYTFQPKENGVDDGNMLPVRGGGYRPNPWGLCDMQGNVAEWTRSGYLPYPYDGQKENAALEKVVRGGSWIDHPKRATAYYRNAYLPWQKVYNVGFRIIIED